jgi:hypothetical protein
MFDPFARVHRDDGTESPPNSIRIRAWRLGTFEEKIMNRFQANRYSFIVGTEIIADGGMSQL